MRSVAWADAGGAVGDGAHFGGEGGRRRDGAEELGRLVALRLLDFSVVEEAYRGAAPQDPGPVVLFQGQSPYTPRRGAGSGGAHLLLAHRVLQEDEVREVLEAAERVQVGQLLHAVAREHERAEVGYALTQRGLDRGDAVPGREEGAQARREGEVGEGGYVVVGEVDRVVRLPGRCVNVCAGGLDAGEGEGEGGLLTLAMPRFSMAGIRWPIVSRAREGASSQCGLWQSVASVPFHAPRRSSSRSLSGFR